MIFGRFALMALGALVMTGLLMVYNYLTNGKPFELGYIVRYGAGHGLGFNRSGWGEAYTLAKAFAATGLDLNAVNRWFFELPIPALLLVAALFAFRKARRYDFLLLGVLCRWSSATFSTGGMRWCPGRAGSMSRCRPWRC